jgi:hypothetical protein
MVKGYQVLRDQLMSDEPSGNTKLDVLRGY